MPMLRSFESPFLGSPPMARVVKLGAHLTPNIHSLGSDFLTLPEHIRDLGREDQGASVVPLVEIHDDHGRLLGKVFVNKMT